MKRLLHCVIVAIGVIYFLIDALFASVAIPLARWIAAHSLFEGIHRWILSLSPYPALALFLVPLIILEPVKPVAAYLAGTGRLFSGCALLAAGELLKLVLVERLFSVTRKKLLSIPAFAWAYRKYRMIRDRVTSLRAWQVARRWSHVARNTVFGFVAELGGFVGVSQRHVSVAINRASRSSASPHRRKP